MLNVQPTYTMYMYKSKWGRGDGIKQGAIFSIVLGCENDRKQFDGMRNVE